MLARLLTDLFLCYFNLAGKEGGEMDDWRSFMKVFSFLAYYLMSKHIIWVNLILTAYFKWLLPSKVAIQSVCFPHFRTSYFYFWLQVRFGPCLTCMLVFSVLVFNISSLALQHFFHLFMFRLLGFLL